MDPKYSITSSELVLGSGWALSKRRAGAHPFDLDEEAKERLVEHVEGSGRIVARDVERCKCLGVAAVEFMIHIQYYRQIGEHWRSSCIALLTWLRPF
jgi:hypothetical protein